ncbi:hypothetical protein Tco_0607883 [Tanacetum coccineum]
MPSSYQKVALLQFERHYWCLQHALLPSYSNESRLRGERVPKVRNVIHKLLLPSFFQSYTWKIAIIHLWKVPEHCIAQKHATDMANVQFMPTLLRFTFFLTLPDGFIVLLLRNGIVSPSKMRTQDGVGVFESTLGRLMFGSSSSARKRILLLPFKQKILVPKRVEFGEAVEKIGLKILEWDCHSRSLIPRVEIVFDLFTEDMFRRKTGGSEFVLRPSDGRYTQISLVEMAAAAGTLTRRNLTP